MKGMDQVKKEKSGEFVYNTELRLRMWIENGEDSTKKFNQLKKRLENCKNRNFRH